MYTYIWYINEYKYKVYLVYICGVYTYIYLCMYNKRHYFPLKCLPHYVLS